jgi:RecJ-like exonuclease
MQKELELGRYPFHKPVEERSLLYKPDERFPGKFKLFKVTHFPNEYLLCLKCNDMGTVLEACSNCGSFSDFTAYGDCIKCNQKHQQTIWACKKCNCKNPMGKTLYHYIQIEGPINNGFWDKLFEYV